MVSVALWKTTATPDHSMSFFVQAVALSDVRRELTFCQRTGTPVLGIVENMSGFVCPHCSVRFGCLLVGFTMSRIFSMQECTNIFSTGGGESLAELCKVPFLGRDIEKPVV